MVPSSPRALRVASGLLAPILAAGLLGGCTPAPARASGKRLPGIDPTDFHHGAADPSGGADGYVHVSTIAKHLDIPWGLGFLPDGSALVTERSTLRILHVTPEGQVTPVARITEATADNEGGLLGLAVSPQYKTDRTVFVYYTTKDDNRVARLRLDGRSRPQPILTGIPKGGIHDGGRLAFGPDGYLYASTGEASRTEAAQNLSILGGKILRMTTDGKPPPGNPFPHSLVWSYGHRNPEGMAWDANGTMYESEIGQAVWDELNIIRPGGDYGWPIVEGIGHNPKYIDPVVAWHPEVGVSSGVAILGETAVVTCLRGQRIYLVPLGKAMAPSPAPSASFDVTASVQWRQGVGVRGRPVEALFEKYGRLRTALTAPDGSVWITTSNRDGRRPGGPTADDDQILRLTLGPG
ncbi:PQQ-dependent sugar dehydrogenase [Dactylosporangium sp. NPDC051485]|uniref:PQQ-dependent sugar dehydrogenase n=1 Tax=Dactylosporangium sp. NPDC051485 TaxID=3154846 RepID=UPI003445B3F8